jgi:uncharacterized protein (TIGR02569 family)
MPFDALQWLDHTARPLAETSELRLSLPARNQSGELVVDGWTAFPYLSGTHPVRQWKNIADVARRFAAAFAEVERPDFVAQRTDAWARADRFAWGEDDVAVPTDVPHVAPLVAARGELDDPPGIVHADLAGNVLFDPVERPAVIDLSLYWRPVEYSVAIIAIDAVCFEGAPLALLHTISATSEFSQYLVRALLFRIVTDALNHRDAYASYGAAVKHVLMLDRG